MSVFDDVHRVPEEESHDKGGDGCRRRRHRSLLSPCRNASLSRFTALLSSEVYAGHAQRVEDMWRDLPRCRRSCALWPFSILKIPAPRHISPEYTVADPCFADPPAESPSDLGEYLRPCRTLRVTSSLPALPGNPDPEKRPRFYVVTIRGLAWSAIARLCRYYDLLYYLFGVLGVLLEEMGSAALPSGPQPQTPRRSPTWSWSVLRTVARPLLPILRP